MEGNKKYSEAARHFLELAASGEARKAFGLYMHPQFRHHNAYFRGDTETLMNAMDESARQDPDKILDIKRILEDRDLVALHSHIRQKPGDRGYAVVHIFRFSEGKIIEMWDLGQEVPAEEVNENGMF